MRFWLQLFGYFTYCAHCTFPYILHAGNFSVRNYGVLTEWYPALYCAAYERYSLDGYKRRRPWSLSLVVFSQFTTTLLIPCHILLRFNSPPSPAHRHTRAQKTHTRPLARWLCTTNHHHTHITHHHCWKDCAACAMQLMVVGFAVVVVVIIATTTSARSERAHTARARIITTLYAARPSIDIRTPCTHTHIHTQTLCALIICNAR